MLGMTSVHAQHTLYVANYDNGFLQSKKTLSVNDGDTIYFQDPGPGAYRPNYLRNNDFQNEESQYCFARSRQSQHFIVFWEKGFGLDPAKAPRPYTFNPDDLLERAEKIYGVNTGLLGFADPATSPTLGTYKIIMFVHYESTWRATGSGVDNKAGTLDVNPDAANTAVTVAHEVGHTFQYIVGCDWGTTHGWRYGFGPNASGGCAWWESCAQWQAYKVYPEKQFADSWSSYIYRCTHLNLLHEQMRYYNFYVQDYWCQLHGQDFIGRLWRESTRPEDPVEAYKRITSTSQKDFCRDMFDYARRAVTWDIDGIRERGRGLSSLFSTRLHDAGDDWLEIDSAYCPQNYGFNVIRLDLPFEGQEVKAEFKGEAGAKGYRNYQADKAGWRYGFVAQAASGERFYSDMFSASEGEAVFTVPENANALWFVVSGAPTEHWHHPWDMGTNAAGNDIHTEESLANDEQWPYRVRFSNTMWTGR